MAGTELSVAVLGAAGTIAPAIVHDLAESEEVAAMTLLDLEGERAQAVADQHGGGRATARTADARAVDELAAALDGHDVLVNTASYRINLDAMRACLKAGCTYIDLGGLYHVTLEQLQWAEQFDEAGLLALLGMGSSPGKTNVMAVRGVRELGADAGAIESIDVFAAGRDPVAPADDRLRPPYAIQTLIDELTLKPIVLRDGAPVEVEPLAPSGNADFGDPIGATDTIYTLHSELATFGESFGCRAASFRLSLKPGLIERLEQLISASPEEIAAAAREAAPQSDQTVSVHMIKVAAASGRIVTVRAMSPPHFGLGGSVVSTAAPAAAAVRLLARGSLSATGVLPPERCVDPDELFAELERRGCRFSLSG